MKRYDRNYSCISHKDQQKLADAKVCVLGCGGLGGYIVEMLGRIGIGEITVVDGDVFDESNLNRQLLSEQATLGKFKAEVAYERMGQVNPTIKVNPINTFFDESNGNEILLGKDLVIDGLDHIKTRKLAVAVCETLNIPFVYGAIAGWYGQVATIMPGDQTMNILYKSDLDRGEELQLGNPSFTPALIASIQVAEAVKYITGKGDLIRPGFLHIDLLNNDFEKIELT